ncbi:hypothetical protein CRUP_031576, partial [Coryphaenoides rupestris]
PPKIHLDTGTGNKNTIVVVAGNRLRLDVEITGEPAPIACWKRGNVEMTETEGRVRVETRKTLSSFVIEGAVRADEGKCSIVVTNAAGEDKAEVYIKIIDIPDGPENLNFDVLEGTTYEAKKMIEGVLYEMRVFAVNGIGVSQ